MLGDAKAKYGPKIWMQLEKESEQRDVLMKSQIPPELVKTDLSDIAPKEQVYGQLAALTLLQQPDVPRRQVPEQVIPKPA